MKVIAVLLCTVFVAVLGERCSQNSDCTITTCADSTHQVICAFRECTCSSGQNGQSCSGDANSCQDHHCRFGRAHCVDGACHCIGDFGGIGK